MHIIVGDTSLSYMSKPSPLYRTIDTSDLLVENTVFIEIYAHALIDAHPLHHQTHCPQKSGWNRWFCIENVWIWGQFLEPSTLCIQLHVLFTLSALLLEWIRYTYPWMKRFPAKQDQNELTTSWNHKCMFFLLINTAMAYCNQYLGQVGLNKQTTHRFLCLHLSCRLLAKHWRYDDNTSHKAQVSTQEFNSIFFIYRRFIHDNVKTAIKR